MNKNIIFTVMTGMALMTSSLLVSCGPQYTEKDLVGLWVEPVPGMNMVQGIALEEGGTAHSVNMATLLYNHWECKGDQLILSGESVGNKVTCSFSDTLKIEKVTADSLILVCGNLRIGYRKSIEECGFSASAGKRLHGTITFAPEVRTFRPDGTETDYWIIDKSGYLQEKYKEADVAEWKIEAELELKEVAHPTAEFAKNYAATYEVMRVIRLDENNQEAE